MKSPAKSINLSELPSVDALLQSVADIELPHNLKKNEARTLLDDIRELASKGKAAPQGQVESNYRKKLLKIANSLRNVINGTGVVIHTNLGRSPLSAQMLNAMEELKDGYVNLELDLDDGRRGNRHDHLRPWIQSISAAEDGILVNNNAAAVLLTLNTLADRKEVIISRGQLVEIGGSFRIPEILRKAGSKLVEVGTTNRTHLKDYEEAITPRTRLLLWVHTSNYKISGFTKEVSLQDLVALGKKHDIPVMADLGSGALVPIDAFGLQREPLVLEVIGAGVDIVTFSVDKLLGGPQGGIIAGRQVLIKKIEKNNLLRALRPDKTQILLTLQALKAFSSGEDGLNDIPVYRDLLTPVETLQKRAEALVDIIENSSLNLSVLNTEAQVGSGASPSEKMASVGIGIKHSKMKAGRISSCLRAHNPAIMGRIAEDLFIIDLKAVRESEDTAIVQALNSIRG
ncbi:MAG: L-seryl-tRNA(Sec) selenium transferase [Candidatus Marinimicrobia bacterium]|jgi:L-seryl-tRNA(Ser) seleniumtransferase|nr:L-seryl-tRNA(Sec) selenium transferase [Candidatus Neomarinimicrobiota bacterium]MBT4359790.1 L-seryl-tRNA(Sec) selenium transferase [Candidatus Neomarinimicrobiota bacterium]MBT4713902.1 L-seryl-tRNA(Sec) selenium transferase [Candidatus Neomarinimicrobiota bacterium]MBT4946887.1 L-seryl-tRNA(Sec) selenium transferase [Candidatus Neomarinimicrobiota bacterium]MBT5270807.1 L-seryl-tRNA(Sec) selenium transferase [Candidatus Neomarinimicrobiota bacterium]